MTLKGQLMGQANQRVEDRGSGGGCCLVERGWDQVVPSIPVLISYEHLNSRLTKSGPDGYTEPLDTPQPVDLDSAR